MNDDLIRRSDAIRAIKSSIADGWGRISPVNACQNIRCLPSVERPKGKWVRRGYWSEGIGMGESYGFYYECSNCGKQAQGGYYKCGMNYCPNCGSQNQKVSE